MRFFTLASALLAGSSAVFAAPAAEQANQCCCCDILAQQVVCVSQAKPDQCMCAEVICPSNAPTVYASGASVATTVVPASLTSAFAASATATNAKFRRQVDVDTEVHPQCCCCDSKLGSIVCTNVASTDNCSCSSDTCPNGAPTIHAGSGASATPTPPPKAHPLVGTVVIRDEPGSDSDVSEPQERDEAGEECCHCDFVERKNICTHAKQCPYPKIDNCVFETTYV